MRKNKMSSKLTLMASAFAIFANVNGEETETFNAMRVVDWGQQSGRMHEESCLGQIFDSKTGKTKNGLIKVYDQDLDGNPQTPDIAAYVPFSLKNRLSPVGTEFDETWVSGKFYGGAAIHYYNRPKELKAGFSEFYNNSCETLNINQPSADFAVHMDSPRGLEYRQYFAPIWLKKDFPNMGEKGNVSFDKTSLFVLNQQRHWGGYDGIRFIARNGDQFYVSEVCKDNWGKVHDIKSYCPVDVKWGKWNPKENSHDIRFDPKTPMSKVTFDNVTAAGFYVFKENPEPIQTSFKFEAFEVFATITKPKVISEVLEMKEVKSTKTPSFYMTKNEISYHKWKEMFKWSQAVGVFAHTISGMTYDRNGDMGSMDDGFIPHHHDEPVTDMTIRDMLVFCNALSEFEGRDYVYYTDPSFKKGTEYLDVIQDPWREKQLSNPDIYVKWSSNGFRLPTAAEWEAAYDQKSEVRGQRSDGKKGTHKIDKAIANKKGFSNMLGNVWEPVWNWGNCLKGGQKDMLVLGDSYAGKGVGEATRHPANGSPKIGLRIVRRDSDLPKPAMEMKLPENIVWNISDKEELKKELAEKLSLPMVTIKGGSMDIYNRKWKNTIDMHSFEMAKTETSYRQWRIVYEWAIGHGYEFDRDGDMGSMAFKMFKNTHEAEEPVTGMTYYDTLTWANALSEMEGYKPVFYEDKELTKVYRKSWRHRPCKMRYRDIYSMKSGKKPAGNPATVNMDWSANGYRTPSLMEWHFAFYSGKNKEGSVITGKIEDVAWIYTNAGMRTHKVDSKPANSFGLHGMYGNVLELWVDSNTKGGQSLWLKLRNQTKHPVQHLVPDTGGSRWRAVAKKGSFLHPEPTLKVGDVYGYNYGQYPGWGWPDAGFRVVRCKENTYPKGGVEEGFTATDFKKSDLKRKKNSEIIKNIEGGN